MQWRGASSLQHLLYQQRVTPGEGRLLVALQEQALWQWRRLLLLQ